MRKPFSVTRFAGVKADFEHRKRFFLLLGLATLALRTEIAVATDIESAVLSLVLTPQFYAAVSKSLSCSV